LAKLIAEIGINHLGAEEKLLAMIQTLVANEIDSCKLQYRSDIDFFDQSMEMGSTLISDELAAVNMSLESTVKSIMFAQNLGIEVGVSFFRTLDAKKLVNLVVPDYFKVPSAEALNFELIEFLQSLNRPVYVSTGGLNFTQLTELSSKITFRPTDCVMYCVANYPAALGSSNPEYIEQYRKLFSCKIGYSSHDLHWEMNVAFLDRKVDIIERHFAFSKDDIGLDISTSSDIDELKKLQEFCKSSMWSKIANIKEKSANQGELQNLKDLGSGYYFKKNYTAGDIVSIKDMSIISPCRGIRAGTIQGSIFLAQDAIKGDPLSQSHIDGSTNLGNDVTAIADQLELSLPVRLHDFERIDKTFNLTNYEWHLSYVEVKTARNTISSKFQKQIKDKKFSIHLPDYISPNKLIDPLSANKRTRTSSLKIIQEVVNLASDLQDYTGHSVPIVGSFSVVNESKLSFYQNLSEMIDIVHEKNCIKLLPQFLPKVAWYFGGSVDLDVFCHIDDLISFEKLPFGICLDVAHCIMAANYFNQDHSEWINKLLPLSTHLHVSDAKGINGEGVPFGDGELNSNLNTILNFGGRKVIEQWEGHLNNYQGFKESLNYIVSKTQ